MITNNKITYWNTDGLEVSQFIKKGKTKLFDTREEAYEYATLKRSYPYQVNVYEEREENMCLIGYQFAVPQ